MGDDLWEMMGQHMLARATASAARDLAEFIGPPAPPKRRPPEQFRPGARRLTHIKHTTQRWAAH